MDVTFHYHPELLNLLIEAIPALIRGKTDVLLFFKGAGIGSSITQDLQKQLNLDRKSIGKHEIARKVLTRLNERGDAALEQRREVLKRISEWEDFSTCWPNDRLKAMALVGEIRRVINVKDSFTRMKLEKEAEERRHRQESEEKYRKEAAKKAEQVRTRDDLSKLFTLDNPQERGKSLEGLLNRLFKCEGLAITEAFTLTGPNGEGIVEQIDGAIEIGGNVYLVEMKWTREPLGTDQLSQHLMRIFLRGGARAIFISNGGYTDPAISMCRDALKSSVVVLCRLEEFIVLLEKEADLAWFLNEKIQAAIVYKNPYHEPIQRFF